jgi:hypothetical protein
MGLLEFLLPGPQTTRNTVASTGILMGTFRSTGFRFLAIFAISVVLFAVGGIAIIGLIYASLSAGFGLGIIICLAVCFQLPIYLIVRRLGFWPEMGCTTELT